MDLFTIDFLVSLVGVPPEFCSFQAPLNLKPAHASGKFRHMNKLLKYSHHSLYSIKKVPSFASLSNIAQSVSPPAIFLLTHLLRIWILSVNSSEPSDHLPFHSVLPQGFLTRNSLSLLLSPFSSSSFHLQIFSFLSSSGVYLLDSSSSGLKRII